MDLTHDQVVAGQNVVWLVASLVVAAYMGLAFVRRLRSQGLDDTARIMLGVIMVASGAALHRFFWTLWRLFRAAGLSDTAAVFPDIAGHVAGPAVIMICAGYALHLYAPLRAWFGRAWAVAVVAFYGAWFLLGAGASSLVSLTE